MSTNLQKLQCEFLEELDLKQSDAFEAGHNLIGFFETLYNINQRVKKERVAEKTKKKGGVSDD